MMTVKQFLEQSNKTIGVVVFHKPEWRCIATQYFLKFLKAKNPGDYEIHFIDVETQEGHDEANKNEVLVVPETHFFTTNNGEMVGILFGAEERLFDQQVAKFLDQYGDAQTQQDSASSALADNNADQDPDSNITTAEQQKAQRDPDSTSTKKKKEWDIRVV